MFPITQITDQLFAAQDLKFRDFLCPLLPGIDPERIIGVRTPELRVLAKTLAREPETTEKFLRELPHRYIEEQQLHAFLLEPMRDFDACAAEVEAFLPYIDNWAACDQLSPRVFGREPERLLPYLSRWLRSEHVYTVRFAIDMLMKWFLDKRFSEDYLRMVAQTPAQDYYLQMAVAWFFATALAKHYDETLPYLTQRRLEPWTHNKTIQKAIESRRISDTQKAYLRGLKIKTTKQRT